MPKALLQSMRQPAESHQCCVSVIAPAQSSLIILGPMSIANTSNLTQGTGSYSQLPLGLETQELISAVMPDRSSPMQDNRSSHSPLSVAAASHVANISQSQFLTAQLLPPVVDAHASQAIPPPLDPSSSQPLPTLSATSQPLPLQRRESHSCASGSPSSMTDQRTGRHSADLPRHQLSLAARKVGLT